MTEAEVRLEDEKLRAEVSKLINETAKLQAEAVFVADRMKAEITKLNQEARLVTVNTFLAPFLAAAALMGATAALVKLFF